MVQDTHFLLTKNSIIEKVKELFGSLAASLREETGRLGGRLPGAVHLFAPKISKGEYYQGLPYVMLDYPRVFGRQDVLAMRTMFWWGHFFSVTLLLKGSYQRQLAEALLAAGGLLGRKGFCVSVSGDEWRHDFDESNYAPLNDDNLREAVKGEYCKVAVQISLAGWNDAARLIGDSHRLLLGLLAG